MRGFPTVDLAHVQRLYEKTLTMFKEYTDDSVRTLTDRIQGKLVYLLAAANLSRTQWTQFEDEWMAIGLILLITSMLIYAVALTRAFRFTYGVFLSEEKSSKMQSKFHGLFPFKRILVGFGVVAVTAGEWKMNILCF